jgi:hypothetical protein
VAKQDEGQGEETGGRGGAEERGAERAPERHCPSRERDEREQGGDARERGEYDQALLEPFDPPRPRELVAPQHELAEQDERGGVGDDRSGACTPARLDDDVLPRKGEERRGQQPRSSDERHDQAGAGERRERDREPGQLARASRRIGGEAGAEQTRAESDDYAEA